MEFERGVGGAALANDVDRRLLAKGRDPDEAAGGAGLSSSCLSFMAGL